MRAACDMIGAKENGGEDHASDSRISGLALRAVRVRRAGRHAAQSAYLSILASRREIRWTTPALTAVTSRQILEKKGRSEDQPMKVLGEDA